MRKMTIAAASALMIMMSCDANAMTLGSLRPDIIRSAASGHVDLTSRPAGLSWLMTIAATTVEEIRARLGHAAPTGPAPARETFDI